VPFALFPKDALDHSDHELGGMVLGWFIAEQAHLIGLPVDEIPEEFAEAVRQRVLALETNSARNAAVEKCLHRAASGDLEAAGKFLREHMERGAVEIKFVPIGIEKVRQATEYGKIGGSHRREIRKSNDRKIVASARKILSRRTKRISDRNLASLIEKDTDINHNTVRGRLKPLRDAGKIARNEKMD